jgi:hypothetical protein
MFLEGLWAAKGLMVKVSSICVKPKVSWLIGQLETAAASLHHRHDETVKFDVLQRLYLAQGVLNLNPAAGRCSSWASQVAILFSLSRPQASLIWKAHSGFSKLGHIS